MLIKTKITKTDDFLYNLIWAFFEVMYKIIDIEIKLKKILLCIGIIAFIAIPAFSTEYFISPSGDDANDGLSEGAPFKTFEHAFNNHVESGSTLTLLDGTYNFTNATGIIGYEGDGSSQPVSGISLSQPTIIKAKTTGNVTVDSEDKDVFSLFLGRSTQKKSYIKIEGIRFEQTSDLFNTSSCTIKDCGFRSGDPTATGGVFTVGTSDPYTNDYNLVEDCWFWGYSRVLVGNYRADGNVWRRCVIRRDGCPAMAPGSPCVGFTVYDSSHVSIQNMIIIDGTLGDGQAYADFATAQHTEGANFFGPNEWFGCISLFSPDNAYAFEADNSNDNSVTMENCVSWYPTELGFNVASITFENIALKNCTSVGAIGSGFRTNGCLSGYIRNAVSCNNTGYGFATENIEPFYVCVSSNGDGSYNGIACSSAPLVYDPLATAILHKVRIEVGTELDGTGWGGGDYGANILYKYGTDGTRYGDAGYNTLTTNSLWPYPNEDLIKTQMSADSTRGFCASGQSLTKYIYYQGFVIGGGVFSGVTFE